MLDDPALVAGLRDINPNFGDFCARVAGEAWSLPLIDQKTKALITIAVDVVNQDHVGPGNPFGAHVNMALKQGATRAEIEESLMFMCVRPSLCPYAAAGSRSARKAETSRRCDFLFECGPSGRSSRATSTEKRLPAA